MNNPLEHHIPGIGVFSIDLDAFTTSGLELWIENLRKNRPQSKALIEAIATELTKRSKP
jgi:hypothetical protein